MASESGLATTNCLEGAIPVLSGLANHLNNQDFSDFVIKTTAGSISAHRLILSLHSSVLAKACKGDFRETSQAFIDLLHEPAACVEAMIYYMYHFDYELPESEADNPSAFHVSMAVIADKYDIMALKDAAFLKCQAALPSAAEQADVFAETVDLAFESIVAVQDICKYLVQFSLDNREVGVGRAIHPSLKKVMQKYPDLAMAVTEAMHTRLESVKAEAARYSYKCPGCHQATKYAKTPDSHTQYMCHYCGGYYDGRRWYPTSC